MGARGSISNDSYVWDKLAALDVGRFIELGSKEIGIQTSRWYQEPFLIVYGLRAH